MNNIFVRNILKLAGGTGTAQLINIISIPILARLYVPEHFAALAIFTSIVAIASVLTTLKFENAIIAVKQDLDAAKLVLFILFWSVFSSIFAFFTFIFLRKFIHFTDDQLTIVVAFSAVMSIVSSLNAVLYFYNNRHQNYSVMTKGRVYAAFTVFAISISGFYLGLGAIGLLTGALSGAVVNLLYQFHFGIKPDVKLTWQGIVSSINSAKKYRRFPLFLVPSSFIDRLASQTHTFFFAKFFSPEILGALNLHNRVTSLPASVVGASVSDVFKKSANDLLQTTGNCSRLFFKTTLYLALLAIVPTLVLGLYGVEIYTLVFGEKWKFAGEIAEVLAPMFFFSFVVSPVSAIIYLEKNQKFDLFLQLFLLSLLLLFFYFSLSELTPIVAVKAYMSAYIIKYVLEFFLCARLSSGHGKVLPL
ncbi:hypothetical protein CWB99_04145 [Pseudoalteromonas rubra]|uniref:Polysaccharide biosynthesis protein n=1 Tax=Pseudoalteromonas rubra TaxID=43658 RepID=A0A5S3WSP4_9GAMM|nr:oligosaccharide flippase family protein [Pseudoalteromonas rubra]TMP31452.1 hypothetical protein CWB99_04145 [Pseudoalteromonas rubra]TMP34537.1 hypothetical protein CWC00_07050 [Pseudoalteromonas rubra]